METILEKLGKVSITPEGVYNSRNRYKRLSLVTLTTGDRIFSYLSRKDVPVGTSILNTEYWMPVSFDATYKLQSDWNETGTNNPAYIRNKPTKLSQFTNDLVFRTINHETIKGEDNINIHDGFYFPNAVQDYDGNWYGAVVIGDQVWLGEALRTTHYNDGTPLVLGSASDYVDGSVAKYFYPSSNSANVETYGLLYNWKAVMNNAEASNTNPSNVSGISPTGFHIPSKAEFEQLCEYVNNQNRHSLNKNNKYIAKALAATYGWNSGYYTNRYYPGYKVELNNSTGFSALAAGYTAEQNSYIKAKAYIWTASINTDEESSTYDYPYSVRIHDGSAVVSIDTKDGTIALNSNRGMSVRCVSNLTPVQFRDWYIKQYGSLQHRLQSDWAQTDNTAEDFIKNKPNFETELLYEEVTYSELTTLISNNNLVKNKKYRITDYVTTTSETNTNSAEHAFDIIVTAISENKLDSKASAILNSEDTYFSSNGADLTKWQIWYDVNNDTNKYSWADTTNGKGVIYRMIDELGNDCPYDFKNILFTRASRYTKVYTFNFYDITNAVNTDYSLKGQYCYDNIISRNGFVQQSLPFNVFLNSYSGARCYNNVFNTNCYNNTFNRDTNNNVFGINCYDNTFKNGNHDNIFGNDCVNNSFDYYCVDNIIGNSFQYNTVGNNFYHNNISYYCTNHIIGKNFKHNVIGKECHSNSFGDNCEYNTFGDICSNNIFVDYCENIVFGTDCSYIEIGHANSAYSYNKNITIESGNKYINVYSSDAHNNTNYLQNIYIAHNCSGTDQAYTNISTITRNRQYRTTVAKESNNTLRIYNEDDPVATPSAADVHALPDSTKYGASLELSFDDDYTAIDDPTGHNPASEGWYVRSGTSPNYVYTLTQDTTPVSGTTYYTAGTYIITATLKDQDGNTLGTQQVVDLPLESVVVDGHYDSNTKTVILVLKNGSEISFSVADLVSGLQSTLVSGTNIKTINGVSILGSGNLNTHNLVYAYENTQVGTSLSATIQESDFSIVNLTMLQCYFGHNVPASATLTIYNSGSVTPMITSAALYRKGAAIGADVIKAGDYAILMYSSSQNAFVVTQISSDNTKQDTLVSGTNIKTINNTSLLGSGNISIADVVRCTYTETDSTNHTGTMSMTIQELQDAIAANKVVILVRGDLVYTLTVKATIAAKFTCVQGGGVYVISYHDDDTLWHCYNFNIQESLVSGNNIKTINNQSLLGNGNINMIVQSDWNQNDNTAADYINNKPGILQTKGNSVTDTMSQQAISELIDNAIRSLQEEIHYYHGYPTAFVIDQRGTNTDPATMVSANLIVNNQNLEAAKAGTLKASTILDNSNVISASGSVGSESVNTITWLRKHSHVFVGKWDGTDMKLRQLSDNDKTKFVDGEDATNYITGAAADNNITYDVWMKLPCDIYYKGFPLIPDNDTVPNQDLQLIIISKEIPSDPENWEKWDGNKLIGIYEAYVTGTTMYSLSGKIPKNNITQTNSKTYARNRGTGFKLVDLQANNIMALLFYGYYSTLHSQGVCGSGTVNSVISTYYPKKTGLCNNLGMTDTTTITGNGAASPAAADIQAGEGTGIVSINFCGIENWWGDLYEWMDDLQVMQARRPSSVSTPNPDLYVDDYINKYVTTHTGATGAIINIVGKDTLLTPIDIADTTRFIDDDKFISIKDTNENIIRIINTGIKENGGNISKCNFGDHCDVFPKALGGNYNVNRFCDYGCVESVGCVALRSHRATDANGGVACLKLADGAGSAGSSVGSRLLFEGNHTNTIIVTDPTLW